MEQSRVHQDEVVSNSHHNPRLWSCLHYHVVTERETVRSPLPCCYWLSWLSTAHQYLMSATARTHNHHCKHHKQKQGKHCFKWGCQVRSNLTSRTGRNRPHGTVSLCVTTWWWRQDCLSLCNNMVVETGLSLSVTTWSWRQDCLSLCDNMVVETGLSLSV